MAYPRPWKDVNTPKMKPGGDTCPLLKVDREKEGRRERRETGGKEMK